MSGYEAALAADCMAGSAQEVFHTNQVGKHPLRLRQPPVARQGVMCRGVMWAPRHTRTRNPLCVDTFFLVGIVTRRLNMDSSLKPRSWTQTHTETPRGHSGWSLRAQPSHRVDIVLGQRI